MTEQQIQDWEREIKHFQMMQEQREKNKANKEKENGTI